MATKPPPLRRRKGGRKPGPYLSPFNKFLSFLLKSKGPGYFHGSIGAIEADVREHFKKEDPKNKCRLPTSRSGLQYQIKKWMREHDLL